MTAGVVILVGVVLFLGVILLAFRAGLAVMKPGGASDYLCDGCKYNDARYCSQPERPNAKVCSEFKARVA